MSGRRRRAALVVRSATRPRRGGSSPPAWGASAAARAAIGLPGLLVCLFALFFGACFDAAIAPAAFLACGSGDDCPSDRVCLAAADGGRCVGVAAACIVIAGRAATALADGTSCDKDGICVAGACVEPRCGDGVRSGVESCDGEAGCRADCSRCGDGIVDDEEECDDGGANDDARAGACRTDCVAARCGDGVRDPGEGCDDGPANSAVLADACRDDCAPARCGDGVRDDDEECDDGDGNGDAPGACRATCASATCGDGVLDNGEECDTGTQNSDVRAGACRTTCVQPACGDGVRDPGESCDEGSLNDDRAPDACRSSCAVAGCGDGVVDDGEQCDDGTQNSDVRADACRSTCVRAGCGDGILDTGEQCDDGTQNSDVRSGACRTTCVRPACGDGVRDPGEGCDDGDTNDDEAADGCRTTCAPARCGDGVLDRDEDCDDGDGNGDAPGACRSTCVPAACGDGVVDDGEQCDDGARNSDTAAGACRKTCVVAACGDGVRDPGEGCDDGPGNSDIDADACRTSCARATCGDGVVDAAEACDDGDEDSGDGCRGDCQKREACGDLVPDSGEDCDDGNDNPRDGCDQCRRMQWQSEVLVSGAIGSRVALDTPLSSIGGVVVDPLGQVYFTEAGQNLVRRMDVEGDLTTIAGTGTAGFAGDGGRATSAELFFPLGIDIDNFGRVYIADSGNDRIRRVDADGTIRTVLGGGDPDNQPGGNVFAAREFPLSGPADVAIDDDGKLFVADTNNDRIVVVDRVDDEIARILIDNRRPPPLFLPVAVEPDGQGGVFVSYAFSHAVYRVDAAGNATRFAGTGEDGFSGDGGNAVDAALSVPVGLGRDRTGNLFIAAAGNNRIRRVDTDGIISTFAGTGAAENSGDGGPALAAALGASDLAVDGLGRIFFVGDSVSGDNTIRRIDADGIIATIAGNGRTAVPGDGGEATSAAIVGGEGLAVDLQGRVLVADTYNNCVRRIEFDGTTTVVAGDPGARTLGDGGPATSAALFTLRDVAVDREGRTIVADGGNFRVRRVERDGTIITLAGNGTFGVGTVGVRATEAALLPAGVAVDGSGRVIVADGAAHRIVRIDEQGILRALAGTGTAGYSGDGGPAAEAQLAAPFGVAVDVEDRVLIVDHENRRVRRIESDGTIITIAGNGSRVFAGDGVPATATGLVFPTNVTVDGAGRVLFADDVHVRRIEDDGTISTILGTATPPASVTGFSGEGGPATAAGFSSVRALAIDAVGRLVVSDGFSSRIRRVEFDGTVTTIGGALHPVGPGRGGRARLYPSAALAMLPDHAVVSVGALGRALRFDPADQSLLVVVGSPDPPAAGLGQQARYAPLLDGAGGIAVDPIARAFVITETGAAALRVVRFDIDEDDVVDDPARWTSERIDAGQLQAPSGIAWDAATDTFVVVETGEHCVRRIRRSGALVEDVYGRCGAPGNLPGFLSGPTHVAVSATGAVYVADTDNDRVLRVVDGNADVVVGDGSKSSTGDGQPARLFAVRGPGQLALDAFGNLFVAATTSVRLVANVDGDADADGDDAVLTAFGGVEQDRFPARDALCLVALAASGDGPVVVADVCQGFLVELRPVALPRGSLPTVP